MKTKLKKVQKKISSILKKITNKEFLQENIKIVILGILGLIFLVAIILYLILSKNVSQIEENKIKQESRDLVNYIDDIVDSDSKEIDKYIIYALDYSYNVNSINTLNSEEISDFLEKNINVRINEKDINKLGITPIMLKRNVTFDSGSNSYTLNDLNLDKKTLSETKITYYRLDKIKRKSAKKYKLVYTKFVIEDPYEMLNYFLEYNTKVKDSKDLIDIYLLKEYLVSGKVSNIKEFLNSNDLNMNVFSKKKGKLKIICTVDKKDDFQIIKMY